VYAATDSRGVETRIEEVRDVADYTPLTCNQKVNIDLEGVNQATVTVDITGICYQGTIGTYPNSLQLYFRYCEASQNIEDLNWTYIDFERSENTLTWDGHEYKTTYTLADSEGKPILFDYQKSYKIQCLAMDFLGEKASSVYAAKLKPVFDWSENDFNFNVPVTIQGVNILEKLAELESRLG
jgi:hypothetical protein